MVLKLSELATPEKISPLLCLLKKLKKENLNN